MAADLGDVLTYILNPTTGMRFLRWKYGLETPPADTVGKTLEDIKREDALLSRVATERGHQQGLQVHQWIAVLFPHGTILARGWQEDKRRCRDAPHRQGLPI